MTGEQQHWQALFSGDLRQAAAGFEALRRDGAPVNADAGLFLALAFAGSDAAAKEILTGRDRNHGDLGLLLWRATWIGASNNLAKALDLIDAFLDRTNAPPFWRAPLYYGRGHIASLAGDREQAIKYFIEAGQAFQADAGLYLGNEDATLRSVAFQSMHMLTEADMHRLAEEYTAPSVTLDWIDDAIPDTGPDRAPIVVSAADPHYLNLYGAAFADSLFRHHPGCRLHLHLADGTTDDFTRLKQLLPAELHHRIGFSMAVTDRWPVHKPPVYASARFLAAPALLERLRQPVLLLDIDATLKRPLDALFATATGNDIACWVRPDGGPGGYTAAGAVSFSPGRGEAVAKLTAAYIDKRLSEEARHLWFVDQAALFRACHHMSRNAGDSLHWGDFSPHGAFADYFDHAPESPDKRR
ncbi:MAG: hypothetical protein RIM72_09380 [Alphaproteobacteria bacterium]